MSETLSPRALCTLADVKRWIPGFDTASDRLDDAFKILINSESRSILEHTGREFAPADPDPDTRVFRVTRDVVDERELEIGDIATATGLEVVLKLVDGTTVETVDTAAILPLPLTGERLEWDPITSLEFPLAATSPAALAAGQLAHVTATWGFPGVPQDVRLLTSARVVARAIMDVSRFGQAFAEQVAEGDLRNALNVGQRALSRYRIPSIG